MGSKPKAPNNSAQIAAAQAQTQQLEKQNAELKAATEKTATEKTATEKTAMENTDKLKGIRRRQGGRALLINTSETGLTENNNIGT